MARRRETDRPASRDPAARALRYELSSRMVRSVLSLSRPLSNHARARAHSCPTNSYDTSNLRACAVRLATRFSSAFRRLAGNRRRNRWPPGNRFWSAHAGVGVAAPRGGRRAADEPASPSPCVRAANPGHVRPAALRRCRRRLSSRSRRRVSITDHPRRRHAFRACRASITPLRHRAAPPRGEKDRGPGGQQGGRRRARARRRARLSSRGRLRRHNTTSRERRNHVHAEGLRDCRLTSSAATRHDCLLKIRVGGASRSCSRTRPRRASARVITVGNPFGLVGTATAGIISS